MTSVLVVDDHPLVRAGLAALMRSAADLDLVGEAADGEEAVRMTEALDPDVVLMDLSMPGVGGVEATRQLMERRPRTSVVVLTSFSEHRQVSDSLRAGAVGYLLKDSDPEYLLGAIRSAASGQSPLDPRVARALLPAARPAGQPAGWAGLTVRERQVLDLVAQGWSNRQVGRALGIAERTVKVHMGNLFRRIGVCDRTSAALWARDNLFRD